MVEHKTLNLGTQVQILPSHFTKGKKMSKKTIIELEDTESAIVFKADGKPEVYMPGCNKDNDRDATLAELAVARYMLTFSNEKVKKVIDEEFEKAMDEVESE